MTARYTLLTAVASVSLGLTAAAVQAQSGSSQPTAPLEGYADYNPSNKFKPSTFYSERGGTLKPADPRNNGNNDSMDASYRTARTANMYDNAGLASDRQAPVEARTYTQTDTSSQVAVNNNMNVDTSANGQRIKPGDPAVILPDTKGNGGVDRVLAEDRNLPNRVYVQQSVPSNVVARDMSTNPIDSLNDPAFRQPAIPADQQGRLNEAMPAGERVVPDATLNNNTNWNNNSNLNNTGTLRSDSTLNSGNLNNRTGIGTDQPAITNVPTPMKGERAPNQITNDRNPPTMIQNGSINSTANNNGIGVDNQPVRPVAPRDTTPGVPAPQFSPNNANDQMTPAVPRTTEQPRSSIDNSSLAAPTDSRAAVSGSTSGSTMVQPQRSIDDSSLTPPTGVQPQTGTMNTMGGQNTGSNLSSNPNLNNSGAMSSPNTGLAGNNIQNDARLDLPAIRTSLTKFVDGVTAEGGIANLSDLLVRADRDQLNQNTHTDQNDELTTALNNLRQSWRQKYNADIRAGNNALALADGFRIVSPDMVNVSDRSAQLAGERTGANEGTASNSGVRTETGNQVNARDSALKDRPNVSNPNPINDGQQNANGGVNSGVNSGLNNNATGGNRIRTESVTGDHAVVIIPVAAICVDNGANPHAGAHGTVKDRNPMAGAGDKARGAVVEGTGKAVEATGDATNLAGQNGNRVGDGLNRAGQTLQAQGQEAKAVGDAKAHAHGGKYANIADRRVHLMKEDGQWKLDLPSGKDAASFRKELAMNLKALNSSQAQWPADQTEAYRMLAAHVLAAAGE